MLRCLRSPNAAQTVAVSGKAKNTSGKALHPPLYFPRHKKLPQLSNLNCGSRISIIHADSRGSGLYYFPYFSSISSEYAFIIASISTQSSSVKVIAGSSEKR